MGSSSLPIVGTTSSLAVVATTTVKITKKDATSWCEAQNGSKSTVTVGGVSVPNSASGTCKLK